MSALPPEHELMLLAAGTRARREASRSRIGALAANVDPSALAELLAARRLLPLFGTRLLEEAPGLLPDSFVGAVERSRQAARVHGMGVETLTRRVTGLLEDSGIPTLALKGPLLASALYGDFGLRMTHDVDLLVPSAGLDEAVAVVRQEGYGPPREGLGRRRRPELHFELAHPALPSVELHWRVHWYERAFSRDLLERSVPDPDGIRRAQLPDELASLLLFYARDGFYGLRQAADLAQWWDLHAEDLAPGGLDGHARTYPSLRAPLRAAMLALERTTGVPAERLMSDAPGATPRERRAVRLAAWSGRGDPDQLRANRSLVRGLLGSRASHPSLLRHDFFSPVKDFPPGAGGGGARSILSRASHVAKLVTRYALGLWSVRDGRDCDPLPPRPA